MSRTDVLHDPERLIFEYDPGHVRRLECPSSDVSISEIDEAFGERSRRSPTGLPHVSEVDIARHFARLASLNFGVDSGPYPLGSCTMKHNPKVCEDLAREEGFMGLHPYQPIESMQGALRLMLLLERALCEIAGMDAITLQPAAGAHGELTGLMVIRACLEDGGGARSRVIIPDSAHGTNPATVAMCGYEVVTVPSDDRGGVDIDALRAVLDDSVAAIMLTNPNTLGLFDENILEITEAVHRVGAFTYCDGANMNAILGKARPGDMGFDALHLNLHKTFATPHGGGGPGSGPVAVCERLAPYLPGPIVAEGADGLLELVSPERSIGRVRSFLGNFGIMVRAWAYIRVLGSAGLEDAAEQAVLSANYLMARLQGAWDVAYDRPCMHEFVLSGKGLKERTSVRTLDVAKRLLDHGIHPPTIYFPLIVEEAMMFEPTETESMADLDGIVEAMLAIADEVEIDPEIVRTAPHTTPVRRLDEAGAVRHPDLRWAPGEE